MPALDLPKAAQRCIGRGPKALYGLSRRYNVYNEAVSYRALISLGTDAAMYSNTGEELVSPFKGLQGPSLLLIQWNDIRACLHECLESGTVRMGTRVVGCSPGSDDPFGAHARLHVRAVGSDESAPAEEIGAALVLVADGFFSKTRQQVFGDASAPVYRDKVVWRALLHYVADADMPEVLLGLHAAGTGVFWTEPSAVPGSMLPRQSAVAYPVGGRRFVWTCISPVDQLENAGVDVSGLRSQGKMKTGLEGGIQQSGAGNEAAKARVLVAFGDFPARLLSVLSHTAASTITEHAYFTHNADSMQPGGWLRGRVALMGDAAHTLPPTGQGVNQAWEDAAVLGEALQTHGITPQALVAYEVARMPRVKAILAGISGMPAQEFAHLLEGVSLIPLTGHAMNRGNHVDAASMENGNGSGGDAGTGNMQSPALAATA